MKLPKGRIYLRPEKSPNYILEFWDYKTKKTKRISSNTPDKKWAEKRLKEIQKEQLKILVNEPKTTPEVIEDIFYGNMTYEKLWQTYKLVHTHKILEETLKTKEFNYRQAVAFLKEISPTPDQLKADYIEFYVAKILNKYKVRTVNQKISQVKSVFVWGWKTGKIPTNPFITLKAIKVPDSPTRILTREIFEKIISGLPEAIQQFLIFQSYSGLRVAECSKVEFSWIKDGRLRIPSEAVKGRLRSRTVPLHPRAVEVIQARLEAKLEDQTKVFEPLNETWKKDTRQVIIKALHKLSREKSIEITSHDARRLFATELARKGVNPVHIMKLMGHTSLSHTKVYFVLNDDDLSDAVSKLD